MSAHMPPSFQNMVLCHNAEEPVFPKACIWEAKNTAKIILVFQILTLEIQFLYEF